VTIDQIDALSALGRRLAHVLAVARLIAASDEGTSTDAVYAIVQLLDDATTILDATVPLQATA